MHPSFKERAEMIGDIITRLPADNRITADVSTRIFPVHVDQDAELPAITRSPSQTWRPIPPRQGPARMTSLSLM